MNEKGVKMQEKRKRKFKGINPRKIEYRENKYRKAKIRESPKGKIKDRKAEQ